MLANGMFIIIIRWRSGRWWIMTHDNNDTSKTKRRGGWDDSIMIMMTMQMLCRFCSMVTTLNQLIVHMDKDR